MSKNKIFNDPVYGFVNIPYGILFDLVEHPYFQRLRRIKQVSLTHYVYPGALHTRFHHALGAMHLMGQAIETLRSKGVTIEALALAQAPRVAVRASRREPTMATLLFEASRGAFRLVEELAPSPGDHVWAYGSDDTLAALRGELPAGVVLHGHGNGFGVAVLDAEAGELAAAAKALARDVALFDQRGCLSPRVALVRGQPEGAQSFARALAAGLAELQHDVPRGALSNSEASDLTRYRDTMTYAGEVFHAGKGVVGLDLLGNVLLAPVGRNVHVTRVTDLSAALAGLGDAVAAVGISGPLADVARKALPGARQSPLGAMQTPPLDGPVDRRPSAEGEVL